MANGPNRNGVTYKKNHDNATFRKSFGAKRSEIVPNCARSPIEDLIKFINEKIFTFLDSIDPVKWRTENVDSYRNELHYLKKEIQQYLQALIDNDDEKYKVLIASLKNFVKELSRDLSNDKSDWQIMLSHLIPIYVIITETLPLFRPGMRFKNLRYTNYSRSVFHICTAFAVVALFEYILTARSAIYVAVGATIIFWGSEVLKTYSETFKACITFILGPVARQHEFNQVNSATWYTTALAILAILYPHGPYSMIGVVVLGIGDPVAAFVGKRFGKHRLRGGKSLEGYLGFVVAGSLSGAVYLKLFHPTSSVLLLSLTAAVTGGLAELFTSEIDDNFTIPIVAATASYVTATLIEGQGT